MKTGGNVLVLKGKELAFGLLKNENPMQYAKEERPVISFFQQWLGGQTMFEAQTSGSTGAPKRVTIRREDMIASARLTAEALHLRSGMTAMLCLDPELIAGKMMMVRCLVTGMNLIVTRPASNPLDEIAAARGIDFAAMVPMQVSTIIGSGRHPEFGKIGTVIIGGAAVNNTLSESVQSLPTNFYATFGMTETISHVALQPLNGPRRTDFFEALPGVKFSIDDRGCLLVDAPFLIQNPLVTNDIVELIDQKRFRWIGRWDNVINTGGIKVVPEEIEQIISGVFSANKLTNRFFVAGDQHDILGQELVLVVEGIIPEVADTALLRELKDVLDKHKSPRRIVYAPAFKVTALGKVRRKESLQAASPRPRQ